MTLPVSFRYAWRSLLRYKRRSLLSIVGIGVGTAVSLFMISFVRGEGEMILRATAQSGVGHLRIAPSGWMETREMDLRLKDWSATLDGVRSHRAVDVATPHAHIDGLLAMGTRTSGTVLTGVDPEWEPRVNRLIRKVTRGEYLDKGKLGFVVIGQEVARRLRVDVGDDLMVTMSGKGGELRSAMLTVGGIVATGSRDLDAALCHVLLDDLERISGHEGPAEITVLLKEPEAIDGVTASLSAGLVAGNAIVTWDELLPELASGVEIDETWTNLMVGVVIVVVFLGIASAQLASVLERRKEFAVLSAIGMKGRRLVWTMLSEGVVLGIVGALLSLLLSVPVVYYISVYGIDFSGMYGEADLAVSSILMDPVLYGEFGWWLVPLAFGLSMSATILSCLYPSWFANRVEPAEALRVDQ